MRMLYLFVYLFIIICFVSIQFIYIVFRYKWIAYIHFNKGVFRLPLQFLLSDDEETPATTPAASIASPLHTPLDDDEPAAQEKGPSIEDLLGGVDKNACELKYEVIFYYIIFYINWNIGLILLFIEYGFGIRE